LKIHEERQVSGKDVAFLFEIEEGVRGGNSRITCRSLGRKLVEIGENI